MDRSRVKPEPPPTDWKIVPVIKEKKPIDWPGVSGAKERLYKRALIKFLTWLVPILADFRDRLQVPLPDEPKEELKLEEIEEEDSPPN